MENLNTKEQAQDLLKDDPELQQRFGNQLNLIHELLKIAEQETDLTLMADGYKTVFRHQDRLCAEMMAWNAEEYKKCFDRMTVNIQELETAFKEAQQGYADALDLLCFGLLEHPRYAFESVILKAIERAAKMEDGSGRSWLWELRLPLIARLRMAWGLVFGSKTPVKEA